MSLDVHLILEGAKKEKEYHSGIFIRRGGKTVEITEEEWEKLKPGVPPVKVKPELMEKEDEVYWGNITHNLGEMAAQAGIYYPLWRPEEIGKTHAGELIPFLEAGLKLLKDQPEEFKKYDDKNNWGTYEQFIPFIEEYLEACRRYPAALIEVPR